jgi:predicted ATPase
MNARTIDRIVVDGYKSIQHCDLTLGSLNVLIGPNGAGKSNFISLFSLLGSMVNEGLKNTVARAGGASTLLRNGPGETEAISITTVFGQNTYEALLGYTNDDGLYYERETCYFHNQEKYPDPTVSRLESGGRESELRFSTSPLAFYCREAMLSWKVYHFHDTAPNARVKQKHAVEDNRFLRPDAANLAAFLHRLVSSHPKHYRRIVDQVRSVAPFFDDFVLAPDAANEERIQLEWKHKTSDAYFNAQSLSDGTLRFICLVTVLLQPEPPSVIVIDEPELGLHPFAITQLADLLRSVSLEHQLIVSTQSVSLLNQLDLEHVVITEQTDDGTTFSRPDPQALRAWLDDYALGELWEKNVLGGRPR